MSDNNANTGTLNGGDAKPGICFFRGSHDICSDSKEGPVKVVREKLSELLRVKNLHFLFGAGTSANTIPVMKDLYDQCMAEVTKDDEKAIIERMKDAEKIKGKKDLEAVLGGLYDQLKYFDLVEDQDQKCRVNSLIVKMTLTIAQKIDVDIQDNDEVLETYKKFYEKIAMRNKDLARVNIFTTNCDLLNEKALDAHNVDYNNGFGGGLRKIFNPARFRYTFSRKVDINLEKYEAIEQMVYLYKLHGSINWFSIEQEKELFPVEEKTSSPEAIEQGRVMIYPTPAKGGLSLDTPYSDLLREFQTKLLLPHSTLVVVGYGFGDKHINNIIYQSLATNASISIVIFGGKKENKLMKINDNRVYNIYDTSPDGENKSLPFGYIVGSLLPRAEEIEESERLRKLKEKEYRKLISEGGDKS